MRLVDREYWCHKPGGTPKLMHKYEAGYLSSWKPRAFNDSIKQWMNAEWAYSSSTVYIAYGVNYK